MINDASILDTRKLMTGKDGRAFVECGGEQVFLAELDTFSVKMNVTNQNCQPVGSILEYAVNTGVSYTLELSELVVRDDVIMKPIQDKIREGKMPYFVFQGGAERWDGQEQRVTLRNCTPDGSLDLLNITPGEIIKRAMTFRINSIPEWLKTLTYEQ